VLVAGRRQLLCEFFVFDSPHWLVYPLPSHMRIVGSLRLGGDCPCNSPLGKTSERCRTAVIGQLMRCASASSRAGHGKPARTKLLLFCAGEGVLGGGILGEFHRLGVADWTMTLRIGSPS
jgi:hypothetical protein